MRRGIVGSAVLFALLVCALSPSLCVAATDWPMWLENPTHRPAPALQPGSVLHTTWSVRCGGIFGSAIVYDGTVYFASRDGFLYAVDDATGQVLWNAQLVPRGAELRDPPGAPLEWWRRCETGFLATPAVDGERIYAGGLDGVFHARLRETGDPAWTQDLMAAIASSPVLTPQLVVVGTRGGDLLAMDRATGELEWLYEAGGPINSSPAFAEGKVVVGSAVGVAAVDAGTGRAVWEARCPDKIDASPCIADGRVYMADWAGTVRAFDLGTGGVLWEQQVDNRAIFASPAVAHDLVYVVTTGARAAALDVDTGAVVWESRVAGGAAYASPVVCGAALVAGTDSGHLCLIDIPTGQALTSISVIRSGYIHGTPTVTDQAIYVTSEAIAGPVTGSVTKMTLGPYTPQAEQLRAREVAVIVASTLGLVEGYAPGEVPEGWGQVRLKSQLELEALRQLQRLGLISQPWHWRVTMNRYQLGALFHKLFWEPNPLNITLPDYTEAALTDFDTFPPWVKETPPKVVGLGLMQPIDGAFLGTHPVTLPQLEASLERVKEILRGP